MIFELTDQLTDSMISAMENQDSSFVVDASANRLVEINAGISGERISVDNEKYYSLPEWDSADGFSVREDFVNHLNSPIARDELQNVLHSGRGVFRNFRNVIKNYPEVDKRWHIFKHRIMSARINDWYNSLREIWGLEKLDQLPESDETLVHDDFSFREYDSSDKETILLNIAADRNDDKELPSEVRDAIYRIWRTEFEAADCICQIGIVCRSLSDDFAGCITASPIIKNQEKIMIVTSLFVPEQFRGLGISTELISMCVTNIQKLEKKWILIPDFIIPDFLQPLLIRTGFKKTLSGYLLGEK